MARRNDKGKTLEPSASNIQDHARPVRSTTSSTANPSRVNTQRIPHTPTRNGRGRMWLSRVRRGRGGTTEKTLPTTNVPPLDRMPSVQTHYMDMLLHLDEIPRLHNILASLFTWILLAGYIVLPGTFTSLQKSIAKSETDAPVKNAVLRTVRNVPLLWIGGTCFVVGATGMIVLWMRWLKNYVWLINRIFLPGLLNSFMGLISTLINVYTAQHGNFSITAKVTTAVTGASTLINVFLFLLYNNWVLSRVKKGHHREREIMAERGDGSRGHEDEGVVEMIQRKANEPALEPGSVV